MYSLVILPVRAKLCWIILFVRGGLGEMLIHSVDEQCSVQFTTTIHYTTLQFSPSWNHEAGARIQWGVVPSDSSSLIHSHDQTARANIQICAKSQILTPMEMIRRRRRVKKPLLLWVDVPSCTYFNAIIMSSLSALRTAWDELARKVHPYIRYILYLHESIALRNLVVLNNTKKGHLFYLLN